MAGPLRFKHLDLGECFAFSKRGKLAVKIEPFVYKYIDQRRDRLVIAPHENRKVFSRACPRNGLPAVYD